MEQIILFIHVLASVGLIGFILIQQGKGAEAGASFGGGSASQTFFGSQGSGNFLTRATAILVTIFFASNLMLGYLATHQNAPRDLDEILKRVESTSIPQSAADKDNDIPSVPQQKQEVPSPSHKVPKRDAHKDNG